jgi:ABC-type phosphate transport system substrate-binding protein
MKKLVLASLSALALLGVAACSDSGSDATTTQSTTPPAGEQPITPDSTAPAAPPATDGSTTQSITPLPEDGGSQTDPSMPAPAE